MGKNKMKRSLDRILTTHTGSLIRPLELREILLATDRGEAADETKSAKVLSDSVSAVVQQQAATGLDVISDGEFGKTISWSQYVIERLDGFERRALPDDAEDPFASGADRDRFSEFYAEMDAEAARSLGGDWGSKKSESVL